VGISFSGCGLERKPIDGANSKVIIPIALAERTEFHAGRNRK
jgi:hypothetical protein